MKQQTDQTSLPNPAESEPIIIRLMRIAEGLELLERMAQSEENPMRRDALYAAIAEAKCI
jgi:hypothetical protein